MTKAKAILGYKLDSLLSDIVLIVLLTCVNIVRVKFHTIASYISIITWYFGHAKMIRQLLSDN